MRFDPTSIAIIGASTAEHKVGHMILKNLVEQGYQGDLYPVNPKGGEILGLSVYSSIGEIDKEIDMAVVVTPAVTVPAVAKECGEKGVQWLVVISAGFSEVHTDEGKKLEEELVQVCDEYNMQLIGPNCLGVLRPSLQMNASFGKDLPAAGNIALVSQSGAMAVAIMDASPQLHLGYSTVLSIGNKAQMNECDYLELCAADEKTEVIGMYLESIADGRRFLEVAKRVAQTKKIVLLKAGISEHGKKAASSHTGALAGNDTAIDAACVQTGIHRAHSFEEFLNLLRTFSTQPTLLSKKIGVITNAGGPGILATDAAEAAELQMPGFSEAVLAELRPHLPEAAGLVNPIDVIGDATTDRYIAALEACSSDANIDGVVVLLTPQVMTPCTQIAEAIVAAHAKNRLMPIVCSFMGGKSVNEAISILAKNGIPNFRTPEQAVKAMAALQQSQVTSHKSNLQRTTCNPSTANNLLKGKYGLLDEPTTAELLSLYRINTPKQALALSADQAVEFADTIGYPVIAKISSPQILHKTDFGGVKANLHTADEVRAAFESIVRNTEVGVPEAEIHGVLIQQFLPIGKEFIVGGLRDPSFGPMVMVGLGGIYTELFKDAVFRIAPITHEEGYRMLQELKSWPLLLGMRGDTRSDIDGVVETLVAISHLMHDCEQIGELDFNPLFVSDHGVIIADAKIVIVNH